MYLNGIEDIDCTECYHAYCAQEHNLSPHALLTRNCADWQVGRGHKELCLCKSSSRSRGFAEIQAKKSGIHFTAAHLVVHQGPGCKLANSRETVHSKAFSVLCLLSVDCWWEQYSGFCLYLSWVYCVISSRTWKINMSLTSCWSCGLSGALETRELCVWFLYNCGN